MHSTTVEAPILVVDDRRENLLSMKALLSPLKQPIVEASSGDEALGKLLEGRFAVILMDVQMPGLNGLDTAALIRKRQATAHIPIIFVTALSRETNFVMQGYQQGAVDYLLKPLDPDILRVKVKCFVDLHVRGEMLVQRERELAERAQAEADARRVAEFEQQVSAMVSHDLRNPLSIVRVNAQLGARTSRDCPHHEKLYRRILSATERLSRLSDDLLDFTRARLGTSLTVQRKQQCLAELTRTFLVEFDSLQPTRSVELAAPERLEGKWDSGRVLQILQNLLDNAVKYGAEDCDIRVSLRQVEGERVELSVENEGPSVEDHKLDTLFDPFTRFEGKRIDQHSLGLGLFIVREIARAHGGDVRAERPETGGMRFVVTLPIGPVAAAAPQASLSA